MTISLELVSFLFELAGDMEVLLARQRDPIVALRKIVVGLHRVYEEYTALEDAWTNTPEMYHRAAHTILHTRADHIEINAGNINFLEEGEQ